MTYIDRLQRLIGFAFPERQLLVRSKGDVKAIVFSPIRQMFMAFAMLGFSYWMIFITAKVLNPTPIVVVTAEDNERDLRRLNQQWLEAQARQRSLQAQLDERTRLFDAATQRMEAAHISIRRIIETAGVNDVRAERVLEEDKKRDGDREPRWRWRF